MVRRVLIEDLLSSDVKKAIVCLPQFLDLGAYYRMSSNIMMSI